MGVDPGLVATGYGVIEAREGAPTLLDAGLIETRTDWPLEARVATVYDRVAALLRAHGPAALVLEDLYSEYRFPRTALLMAHVRGVVCLAARQGQVAVLALSPAEVKRAVAGHGGAAKSQIQRGVQYRLGLDAPPRSSHVADALALALTGLGRLGGGV
jgi:crossover junction endodeoxyribonuclease RuvC